MITFIRSQHMTMSFKFRGLCGFYFLSEAGLTVIQVGPFLVELL